MNVPVLMYHTINNNPKGIYNSWLVTRLGIFEDQLKYLKKNNYHTVTLRELYDFKNNNKNLPPKSIVLTFDDGYLDNWVFVYPLLKRYNFNATIFVNPDFILENQKKRKTLIDIDYNFKRIWELNSVGYLNWEEVKILDKTGIVNIQSHSLTHTWYFSSENIIDFLMPWNEKKYYWFFWNVASKSDRINWMNKPNFNEMLSGYYGHPIFEYSRSLSSKRFIPNEKYVTAFLKFYKKNKSMLNKKNYKKQFLDFEKNITQPKGIFESEKDEINRYKEELVFSKRILEKGLGKKVDFLCWPGGGKNTKSIDIALNSAKYKAYTQNEKQKAGYNSNIKNDKSNRFYRCSNGHGDNRLLSLLTFKFILDFHANKSYIKKLLPVYHEYLKIKGAIT